MNMNFYLNFLMFFSSCYMFSFFYKHILLNLINMEFMMINLMSMMYLIMNMMNMNIFFLSFFLAISICEGVLGLSIMVYMVRLTGNDYSKMLN
uniref:NADH-ubiquinone oxidoreductase chain 4L n=1 Tax=Triraphis sp. QL-2013 TaxID=1421602 RepID=A0A0A6ZL51_9HYME|nr:NADH dehydrogenase subunit 4L [Triraphis sp. QL-2013]